MTTFLKAVLGCSLMACMQITSWAQSEWPKAKPVSLVVAFAPGASTDIVARTLTQKLNELTGGNFIVENKGGAGGNIASAKSNGLHLMAIPSWFTASPSQ
jgi:tripartite-type tricarboxylate transporter receptor subunit TctC